MGNGGVCSEDQGKSYLMIAGAALSATIADHVAIHSMLHRTPRIRESWRPPYLAYNYL